MHGHLGALRAHHRRHRNQVRPRGAASRARPAALSAPPAAGLRSAIAAGGGLKAWPELVVALVQALDSGDVNAADGALDALYKARRRDRSRRALARSRAAQVCEDVPAQVDDDVPGLPMRPAALLVPRLLTLFGRRAPPPRACAPSPLSADRRTQQPARATAKTRDGQVRPAAARPRARAAR